MTTIAMIDIETLDTLPSSQVLSIGGVKFNPFSFDEPHSDFYFKLDIDEQAGRNRTTSESTLDWWGKQDDKIILEAFSSGDRTPVASVLRELKKWCVGVDGIMAQGITFDIIILENMFRQYNMPIPWAFWMVEDSRTLLNRMIEDPRKQFNFDAHNALEDARVQAKSIQLVFEKFKFMK